MSCCCFAAQITHCCGVEFVVAAVVKCIKIGVRSVIDEVQFCDEYERVRSSCCGGGGGVGVLCMRFDV